MIQITVEEMDCFSVTEVKRLCMECRRPLDHLLVLSWPVIKVNGKLKLPNPGRMTNGPGRSGMMVGVTLPRKEPRHAELLAAGRENTEWAVGESSY